MPLLDRLLGLVAAFPQQRVVGIGDLILDQYRRGTAVGLSPEAPAVELLNPGLVETPGGAANVAWNIGHLGGTVEMIGVVGHDREAQTLHALLAATPGVSLVGIEDPSRPTTLKLRFYHGPFQLLRVNQESRVPVPDAVGDACRATLRVRASGVRVLLVADYGNGVIDSHLVAALVELHAARPDLTIIFDPKVDNRDVYRAGMATLLKPNWREACELVGMEPDRADQETVVRTLTQRYDADALITLGGDGILVAEKSGAVQRVPTRPREAFDVAGAGDTTLAVIALALSAGGSLTDAAILANLAGGIVVEKSGTAYVTPAELVADLRHPKTKEILKTLEARVLQHTV